MANKRKVGVVEDEAHSDFVDGSLVMLSEDEDGEERNSESDNGQVDEFPEIDPESDSEDDEEEEDEGSEDEEESLSEDDELSIFPKAKTVVSVITGQPKKVYPEIEPDYDSDSSTEDVRLSSLLQLFQLSTKFRTRIALVMFPCIGTTIYRM
jgi:ribosome biogenesis protein ERB1